MNTVLTAFGDFFFLLAFSSCKSMVSELLHGKLVYEIASGKQNHNFGLFHSSFKQKKKGGVNI